MEFNTYLAVQLDATCNGFQHMALLSNEDTLFKELNLVSKKSNDKELTDLPPSDFYNFLLHRLVTLFQNKVDSGILYDEGKKPKKDRKPRASDNVKGSYERLHKFIWGRAHVKKSIMTIPYNSGVKSMKKHLAASLVKVDCNQYDLHWYSTSESNTKQMTKIYTY